MDLVRILNITNGIIDVAKIKLVKQFRTTETESNETCYGEGNTYNNNSYSYTYKCIMVENDNVNKNNSYRLLIMFFHSSVCTRWQ